MARRKLVYAPDKEKHLLTVNVNEINYKQYQLQLPSRFLINGDNAMATRVR